MRKRSLTGFWPQYFDKNRPKRLGRKIPKNVAVISPKPEDILSAAQKAGYYAEIDEFRKYPRTWWDDPGLVLIDIMGQKKSFVMKKITPLVKKALEQRLIAAKNKNKKDKKNTKMLKAEAELKKRLKEKSYGKGKK